MGFSRAGGSRAGNREEAYDIAMETLNPTLSLTDQEVQAELKRIGEQTKSKSASRVADLVDLSFVKQAAKKLGL